MSPGFRASSLKGASIIWRKIEKETLGCGVGEAKAKWSESEPFCIEPSPAAGGEVIKFRAPGLAEVEAGDLLEFGKAPAGGHAQAEGCNFTSASDGREQIAVIDRALVLFDSLAVGERVGGVTGPDAIAKATGAGPEAQERATAPVIDIVTAGAIGNGGSVGRLVPGEVGDLVLAKVLGGRATEEFFVHGCGEIFIDGDVTGGELGEEGGVFLVDEFIASKVFALECEGLAESTPPLFERLAGNGEHQIHIDVVEPGAAQQVKGLEDGIAAVNSAQAVEEGFVKGLDAEGNAVDAVLDEETGFVERNGGGIALDGELRRVCPAKALE